MAKRKRVQRDWPAVVQAYAASGLSVTAFCRDQGISTSLLYRWRQRYPPGTESLLEGVTPRRMSRRYRIGDG